MKTDGTSPPDRRGVGGISEAQYFRRLLMAVGLLLTLGLLTAGVWLSIQVWLAVFAGILLAIFLKTLAEWVSKATHLPHVWALILVMAMLLGLVVLGGWLLAPRVAEQFSELTDRLPKAFEKLRLWMDQHGWTRFLPEKMPAMSEFSSGASKAAARVAAFFSLSVEAVTNFFVILFLGMYLAAAPKLYVNGLVRLFPMPHRPRAREVLEELGDNLGHWLLGQILSMAVVGTLIGVGLTVLGVPLGLALGVLAGLLDFIPIIGPLVSAIPAILLAFLVSPWHPVYVIGLYVLVNTVIESHLLVPLIQRYAVNLPPAVAVISLLLMGKLFGFLGVLLAIPLACTLLVLVKTVYLENILGDTPADRGKGEPAADNSHRDPGAG